MSGWEQFLSGRHAPVFIPSIHTIHNFNIASCQCATLSKNLPSSLGTQCKIFRTSAHHHHHPTNMPIHTTFNPKSSQHRSEIIPQACQNHTKHIPRSSKSLLLPPSANIESSLNITDSLAMVTSLSLSSNANEKPMIVVWTSAIACFTAFKMLWHLRQNVWHVIELVWRHAQNVDTAIDEQANQLEILLVRLMLRVEKHVG